jgi:aminodeoxyfutalosine deaminase
MDGPPIDDGAVQIHKNRITAVGYWAEVRRNSDQLLDLGEQVLLPGLINAHCHLEYSCLRGVIPRPQSFAAWVQQMISEKLQLTPTQVHHSVRTGAAEALRFGTTTVADIQSLPEYSQASPLRRWRFRELIDLGAREVDVDADFLSPHAPYTASPELYRRCNARAKLVATHVAESAEETAMFACAEGPLLEFLHRLGRVMDDCGSRTPVAHFLERCAPAENYIIAHMNEIAPTDWALLRNAPRFSIVHCPRSHWYFGHNPFAFAELRELGFNLALGTDSLASNDDLSLFAEMRQLRRTTPSLSASDLLELVTTNAAAALRQSDALGRIRPGFLADIIALPFTGSSRDVLENIVAHEGEVSWWIVNGRAGF